MGLPARALPPLHDLRAIPLSGVGTASAGSVLELSDHIISKGEGHHLAVPDATDRYIGVWVRIPGLELYRYFSDLVGHRAYNFPDLSTEYLHERIQYTLMMSGLMNDSVEAPVAKVDLSSVVTASWVFPYALSSNVLEALAPHNEIVPILSRVR